MTAQRRSKKILLTGIAFAVFLLACVTEEAPKISSVPQSVSNPVPAGGVDPASGLLIDEHWQLVRTNCTACHSAQLVTQNRGSRQTWLEIIRWMQETQGLWPLDAATENGILDYLEKNYAPSSAHRRAPLPPAQMPPNPYSEQENI